MVAVDWCGSADVRDQRLHIWTAVAEGGRLLALAGGRNRGEVIGHLRDMARDDVDLVVGLDFAFSFPASFMEDLGVRSAYELWCQVEVHGESWLAKCEDPFWGRRGTKRPQGRALHRRTELECEPVSGIRPKSVFQIAGAGSVGTGSLRGMPLLRELHDSGFSIWPFDPPRRPCVIEIYPRLLTGAVVKRDPSARRERLAHYCLEPEMRQMAESSEDAFDAAVSVLEMSVREDELNALEQTPSPLTAMEGAIWIPSAPDG